MIVILQVLNGLTMQGEQLALESTSSCEVEFMSLQSWSTTCSSCEWKASSVWTDSSKTVLLFKFTWGFYRISEPAPPFHHPHQPDCWLPQTPYSHPPAIQLPKPSFVPINFPKFHPPFHHPISFLKPLPPSHLPVWFGLANWAEAYIL